MSNYQLVRCLEALVMALLGFVCRLLLEKKEEIGRAHV